MSKQTRPYIQFLIKQNLVYLGLFFLLMLVSGYLVPYFLAHINKSTASMQREQNELQKLESRKRILESLVSENSEDIDQDLALITSLIPDSEDYFSMIYALERLSQSSGFSINNYVVNLSQSSDKKLSLSVSGQGNTDTFLSLLRDYNFGGGRLITAERIGIDPLRAGEVGLSLNFYNEKPLINTDESLDFQSSIQELNELRDKVKFSIVSNDQPQQTTTPEGYSTKQNPFQ